VLRETYQYNETCQGTVPDAIRCFMEAEDFKDAIRFASSGLKIRVSVFQHKSGQLTNDQSAANGIAPVQDPGGLGSID